MAGVSSAALLAGFLLSLSFLADGLNLWPMPASVSYGSGTLYLSNDFQLRTEGSRYSDGSGILKEAFQRMVDIIKIAHVVDGSLPRYGVLKGLRVLVFSADDKLNFGTEESYKLSIPANNKDAYAEIEVGDYAPGFHKTVACVTLPYHVIPLGELTSPTFDGFVEPGFLTTSIE